MNGQRDDLTLIDACRRGQLDAYGELVKRYQDRLFAVIAQLIGSPEDAADVLQDAFLKAYQKLDSFHGDSSFYTWIYRIATNLALSSKRKNRQRTLGIDHGEEPSDDRAGSNPTLPLEQAERDRMVQEALMSLSPDHREIVILRDMDELRYEEIAELLRVPVGTVRSRLHRARHELQERLAHMIDVEDLSTRPSRPS